MIILLVILAVLLVAGIALSFTSMRKSIGPISKDGTVNYGPYMCGSTPLSVDVTYNMNRLEGAQSVKDFTVRYGEVTLKNVRAFQTDALKDAGKPYFQFDEYEKYLDAKMAKVSPSSAVDITARGTLYHDYKNRLLLGSNELKSQQELEEFASCFSSVKEKFFDDQAVSTKEAGVFPVYFEKAYLIK